VLWNVKISLKTKIGVSGLMSLGLIATAVAIVRASSLGLKTADLSYDYCIAAIWANTELHVGIIATNLALSRMIWGYFQERRKSLSSNNTPRHGTRTNLSKSRHGYMKSNDRNPYQKEGLDRAGSPDNLSQTSHIPLDPIIKKTMSIFISSSPLQESAEFKEPKKTPSGWSFQRKPDGHEEISPSQIV
jgi:hypothetical protein